MLAIGRGLMAQPWLLMLDEPSLGLVPRIVAEIFEARYSSTSSTVMRSSRMQGLPAVAAWRRRVAFSQTRAAFIPRVPSPTFRRSRS